MYTHDEQTAYCDYCGRPITLMLSEEPFLNFIEERDLETDLVVYFCSIFCRFSSSHKTKECPNGNMIG